jgi:preprotein translocase subunit SecE
MIRAVNRLIRFLKESKAETARMTWPTRDAIIGGTAVVIGVSAVFVIFMWVVDLIISRLLISLMG